MSTFKNLIGLVTVGGKIWPIIDLNIGIIYIMCHSQPHSAASGWCHLIPVTDSRSGIFVFLKCSQDEPAHYDTNLFKMSGRQRIIWRNH